MTEKTNDVIGIGNPLMDFLVEIDDRTLIEHDLRKGEVHFVEEEKAKKLLALLESAQHTIEIVPGGSAANTLRGIGMLGGDVILCGKVGKDKHGQMYMEEMRNHNVVPRLSVHPSTTGHALTFITPDSERTFSVHLGAALALCKEDILEEDIAKSRVLHLEGYQLEGPSREIALHAVEWAKKYNTLVSVDLADAGLIRRNKEFLHGFVANDADIVFMNEMEAKEFTGLGEEDAVKDVGKKVRIAVVKCGERGSLMYTNGTVTRINPFSAKAIDTTGAGDSYAAGVLYGYCRGWPIEKAGMLGSLFAAKVVEQKGVKMSFDFEEIKKFCE